MDAFAVAIALPNYDYNFRVDYLHLAVHQGKWFLVDNGPAPPEEIASRRTESGRKTTYRRDPIHFTRSGRCVPHVFISFGMIVSPAIQKRLAKLPGCIDFKDVVFEKLVDVRMPPIGDLDWIERKHSDYGGYSHTDDYLSSLPHHPEFEPRFAGFRELESRLQCDLEDEFSDLRKYRVALANYFFDESDYGEGKPPEVKLSKKALREYPVISLPTSDAILLRKDVFREISPFLDLDFYVIERIKVTN